MNTKDYNEIKKIIYRNLLWETKGSFPYWNEDDLKEHRLNILKELKSYSQSKAPKQKTEKACPTKVEK